MINREPEDRQHNGLLDAVDALTKERTVHTTITDDETGAWLGVHSEKHPPLLTLLIEGTGITRAGPSSETRIPIDADALEMWGQIRDLVRLWCRQLDASYVTDDLLVSIRHWYLAHANAARAGKLSDVTDRDVTRMVEGWVRMIENKFDPPEKREWKEACPAWVRIIGLEGEDLGYRRCAARRVVVGGEERFAISLNVTTLTAECCRCHSKWEGARALATLRYETNLWNMEKVEEETNRMAELTRLAAGDTPETHTTDIATAAP